MAISPDRQALADRVLGTGLHRLYGTRLVAWDGQAAELELAIRDELKQQEGFVHGGVLAYLADTAMAFAGGGALGLRVVTGEFKLNYVRPALGERLVARGGVVHAGRTQVVCRAEIYARTGRTEKLCVAALGTLVILHAEP